MFYVPPINSNQWPVKGYFLDRKSFGLHAYMVLLLIALNAARASGVVNIECVFSRRSWGRHRCVEYYSTLYV